ncbi:flagellin FliC [bacterium]|nr:flagellin FliC [bacterium]
MAVVINTNVDALKIQSILSSSTNKLSESMQRMSSGMKILSAKDDAAGTVISAKMQVQLNGNQIAQKNVQNANALLSTAEGNLDVIQDNITRIRDLTLQAKNGTYSADEIKAMQDEVSQRIQEIDRINTSAEYSSLRLFGDVAEDGKTEAGLAKNGATFQVGSNAGVDNTITADAALFKNVTFSALSGAKKFNLSDLSKTSFAENNAGVKAEAGANETNFDVAIKALDNAIDEITNRKSIIGSAGNRMDSALDTLTTQYENLSSAKSIITDADIASEASSFTQQQILQQVSTSLLAQANQAPSIALSLI